MSNDVSFHGLVYNFPWWNCLLSNLDSGLRAREEEDVCWNWLSRTLEKSIPRKTIEKRPDLNTEFADFILEFVLETSLSSWRNIKYSGRKRNLLTLKKNRNKKMRGHTVPISTFMCLSAIYILPRSICLFCRRKICGPILGIYINRSQTHESGNWAWGWAIPRKGMHKWDFRCSVVDQENVRKSVWHTHMIFLFPLSQISWETTYTKEYCNTTQQRYLPPPPPTPPPFYIAGHRWLTMLIEYLKKLNK